MGTEIERKFLVCSDEWRTAAQGVDFRQGYLPTEDSCVVRVRTMGEEAVLTIKGRTQGISRQEFEYPIPLEDAQELLDTLCRRPLIEKTRYCLHFEGHQWEIDEFKGENEGLVVAEVELANENESISMPDWIGKEVSDDPRFFNVNLISNPFSKWSEDLFADEKGSGK